MCPTFIQVEKEMTQIKVFFSQSAGLANAIILMQHHYQENKDPGVVDTDAKYAQAILT